MRPHLPLSFLPLSLLLLLLTLGCGPAAAPPQPPATPAAVPVPAPAPAACTPAALPPILAGKAVLLPPAGPAAAPAALPSAVKPPGDGGISCGLVVRLTADVPVWRMWSGPTRKDAKGNTNRIGQWWSYDAPRGTVTAYRTDYEICTGWNDLTTMAACTLKTGTIVAIGPGQSVSAKTCGDAAGQQAYPANGRDWQVWIANAWSRGQELVCPDQASDYTVDPDDIARPKGGGAAAKASP